MLWCSVLMVSVGVVTPGADLRRVLLSGAGRLCVGRFIRDYDKSHLPEVMTTMMRFTNELKYFPLRYSIYLSAYRVVVKFCRNNLPHRQMCLVYGIVLYFHLI